MGGAGASLFLYPHSFSTLSRPNYEKSFFSLKETADRPFFSSIRADGNRPRHGNSPSPKDDRQSSDSRSSLSPNKQEILALFKRIQASISKGETVNSKKRNSKPAEDNKPSAESILEVLHQSRSQGKGKISARKGDKFPAQRKYASKKQERAPHSSTMGLKSTRPTSNFTRRSPIPTLSSPRNESEPRKHSRRRDEIEPEKLSRQRDEAEPKNEAIQARNDDDDDKQSKNFEKMKLAELKEVAKSKGIKGYSKLKKSELVELLIRSL